MEGRRKGTTGSSSERGSGSVVDWQRRKLRGITAQPAKVRSQNCPLGRCTLLLPIGKPAAGGLKHGGYYDCPPLVVTCHVSQIQEQVRFLVQCFNEKTVVKNYETEI